MTLPEHAICSALLAQFGMRQRYGGKGVAVAIVAGIAPDFDVVGKLFGDEYFWKLHHALGHGLLSIAVLAASIASVARWGLGMRPWRYVFAWCAILGCVHSFTDALYWYPIKVFWPFDDFEIKFDVIEYLDLIVLAIWLIAAIRLCMKPEQGRQTACWTFGIFGCYFIARAVSPPPTGWFKTVAGHWMYELPSDLPLIDWW